MRWLSLLAMFLTAALSFGQSSRIVGGFDNDGRPITGYQVDDEPVQWQRLETVPAPTSAPLFMDARHPYSWSNHAWMGDPFTKPWPAGEYEVRNLSVDKNKQKAGAWSQPARVTVKSGAHLFCGGWNLPALQYESGVIWQIKCISVTPECAGWGMQPGDERHLGYGIHHRFNNNVSPFVACEPELMNLSAVNVYSYPLSRLTFGGDFQQVAPPPVVVPTSIPNRRFRVAYCFVAETGETALSPPTAWSDPATLPGWTEEQVVMFTLSIKNHFPQGALGYHVYIQLENEQAPWRRLPASHCHGKPKQADDWLHQLWDRQPMMWQYYDDAPVHAPAANPQSTLSGLHLALKELGWWPWDYDPSDIVVEVDKIITSCPVHDEWGTNGTDQPFKFSRMIVGKDGRKFSIEQKGLPAGANRYWPILHISNSYSQWHNVVVTGNGASAAVSFDEGWGGQCFGNKFFNSSFNPGISQCDGLSYGLLVCERSTSSRGGHTHSEGRYFNCNFSGDVCIRLGGNQTANVNFMDTLSSSGNSKGRRNTVLWAITANEIKFRGLWGADSFSGPVVFASGQGVDIKADHIWKDQPSSTVFEVQTGCTLQAKISSGKLNLWSDQSKPPTLARFAHSPGLSSIKLEGVRSQFSVWPTTADVVAPMCNMVDLRFDSTSLDSQVALIEPTYTQWKSEWDAVFPGNPAPAEPPVPGMRITVPGFTIPERKVQVPSVSVDGKASQPFTITISKTVIGPKTVIFNSLTGQQNVTRLPWK